MNGKKSEYVESKGMNSKDNGRKRSNVKHSRQRLIAKRGRIQARITRKHIHPSLSPRFPIASFPLCRALPFTSPPRKRVTCTQRAYHGQDDTTEVRRRLRLRYVCVYHRETGWDPSVAGPWSIIGSAWYGTRAKHPSAQRRDQVNLHLETAPHTIPPPSPHRSLSRRVQPHPLSLPLIPVDTLLLCASPTPRTRSGTVGRVCKPFCRLTERVHSAQRC